MLGWFLEFRGRDDMNRALVGFAVFAAMSGTQALAADMPLKAPPAPAPVAYDWTGFYLGGFDSFAVNHATASTPAPGILGATHLGAVGVTGSGWGGGVTAGANLQVAPAWLIGLEADYGYLGGGRLFRDWDDLISLGSHPNWIGTVRARAGFVTGPSLLYVTAGVAFVNVTDAFGGQGVPGFLIVPPTSSTTTQTGGVIGAGIETKLSRNWSAKTEYEYIAGGHHTFASTVFTIPGAPTVFYHDYQVIKSGLNYRFNGDWDGVPVNREMLASNHNWNGFYVGGNAGVGATITQTHAPNGMPGGDEDPHNTGFTGGGQVGYNYMLMQKYLIGLEGDVGGLGLHSLVADWFDTGFATFQEKTTWYSTARVRAGVSTGPALLYITGGGGWVRIQEGFGQTGPVITGQLLTRTGSGWTFGGGTEVALDAHWSAKLESLVVNAGNSATIAVAPTAFFTTYKDRFMIVRAGLNYALN
jgi:outer membrane immunogenic protein